MSGITMSLLCWMAWAGPVSPDMSPGSVPPRLATRQTDFFIPFLLESSADRDGLVVDLYCSSDFGRSWQVVASAAPDQKRFAFRAPSDGEYWFLVRTRDVQGLRSADAPFWPELRVLVDTVPPVVRLEAAYDATGLMAVRWEADAPQASSVVVCYRGAATDPWQRVALDPRHLQATPVGQAGSVTWRPTDASRVLEIRAEVHDEAGNRGISQCMVTPRNSLW